MSNLWVSLGPTGRRGVVSGCTLNTETLTQTKKSHVLSKCAIRCRPQSQPRGRGVGPPALKLLSGRAAAGLHPPVPPGPAMREAVFVPHLDAFQRNPWGQTVALKK